MKTEYGIFGKNNSKISTPRRIHRSPEEDWKHSLTAYYLQFILEDLKDIEEFKSIGLSG